MMKKMIAAIKNYMKEYNTLQVECMKNPGYQYQVAQLNAAAHGLAIY